jgi:hypothetical protein
VPVHKAISVTTMSIALAVGIAVAPAQAAGSTARSGCQPWRDVNTFGYSCWGYPGEMRATVLCRDNGVARGPWVPMDGSWSYAYCAGRGGRWDAGEPQYR